MKQRALLSSLLSLVLAASVSAQRTLSSPSPQAPDRPGAPAAPARTVARASVVSFTGYVEVERAATGAREAVARAPLGLAPGDKVLTGRDGRAAVAFRDGSQVSLGPGAAFAVRAETLRETTLFLSAGKLWAAVAKNASRRFSVRTPSAVAAVRGTEFSVEVQGARQTAVEVFGGRVAVSAFGAESMVTASQRVDVTEGRMGRVETFTPRPESVPEAIRPAILRPAAGGPDGEGADGAREGRLGADDGPRDGPRENPEFAFDPERFKEFVEHQAGEQLMRDQRESQAIFEHKAQLYQEGKTLIDAFGRRVRVEEHILRPSADSFQFVSFNFRDDRTDLASVEVTANQTLPERLADAGNLWFSQGSPSYWAVKQRLTMTNGVDSVVELGVDGAPQQFSFAGQPIFDPGTNTFTTGPGGSFYRTMFGNKYEFINGDDGGIDRIWSDAGFRPSGNGTLMGTAVSGMLWRTQPVRVDVRDASTVRGSYWTDAFVTATPGADGQAYAQTSFQPTPGAAHFLSQRSYINFTDNSNGGTGNGILDFGEALTPDDPSFYHDIAARMNGTNLTAMAGAGTRQANGDTLVYSDRLGSGSAAGNPQATLNYGSAIPAMKQAIDFARSNARDFLVADEFAIDDFGRVLPAGGSFNESASVFSGENFERRLRSSLFTHGDIDVVMSPAFIFQSGASNAAQQDRPVPSPGPKF